MKPVLAKVDAAVVAVDTAAAVAVAAAVVAVDTVAAEVAAAAVAVATNPAERLSYDLNDAFRPDRKAFFIPLHERIGNLLLPRVRKNREGPLFALPASRRDC